MASTGSNIARIQTQKSAPVQDLMKDAIAHWRATGIRVAGLVEEAHGLPGRVCSAGILRDIATGSSYSIYLERPPRGTTCHIGASGAERACKAVLDQVESCDLLVLSKFVKLEASGGGLFPAFAAAMAGGTPALTTVSPKHLAAWNAFAPQAAVLSANMDALREWLTAVEARRGFAAGTD